MQSIANVTLYNPFSVFSNNCDTLNADVAFSPNVISNVKYMYNDWLSNIDESVKANVNLLNEFIEVRNGVEWVHVYYTSIMCCPMNNIRVFYCCFFPFLLSLFILSFFLFEFVLCAMVIMCE